ncbi:tRNA threonylcarbamoyladenosine biosynthesis protein TsaE [Geodia barretti]|uniref:tRNA threonylcarbamoyladenosine biosynthesis protein TsaE n=1 Tax=Geodia barretti TaxID=519541 RepID=A0AA35RXI9_GEOBA|nr:tRNA threonylcarbamoyladenosine biosynthesis protein TsaE [Geodia barretti]
MNSEDRERSTLILQTDSPEETQLLGYAVGERAQPGDVFLLSGPLGAGKTCFTQGLARGLGVEGYVRSPTFVLMTRHKGRLTLHILTSTVSAALKRLGISAWTNSSSIVGSASSNGLSERRNCCPITQSGWNSDMGK